MKLLFDQNVSPKLVGLLTDLYPGSSHVQTERLHSAGDDDVWDFARDPDFMIVTKDADYNNMSIQHGWPPKVLWLLTGNCTTKELETLFRSRYVVIAAFENDPTVGTLALK
jgi:predicted nuclease of predicted toxin-antitoxin system